MHDHRSLAVLRFADGDVEEHSLPDVDRDWLSIVRNDRQLRLYRRRTTHDGRPVFVEDPSAAIVTM